MMDNKFPTPEQNETSSTENAITISLTRDKMKAVLLFTPETNQFEVKEEALHGLLKKVGVTHGV